MKLLDTFDKLCERLNHGGKTEVSLSLMLLSHEDVMRFIVFMCTRWIINDIAKYKISKLFPEECNSS